MSVSFPFPPNPTDGQVVSQTQSDGTVLVATYVAAKNEWVVDRQQPGKPTLTLTSGIPYTVPPATTNGQVLTWDNTLKQWVPKAPSGGGAGGGTFAKGTQAAADTTNPPDPTKPTELLKPGMLQSTLENLHKELKAWDGTQWTEVLSEDTIKQWVAAGSLFRGVVKESTLNTLPAVALANRGFYYSWTGNPGHTVTTADPGIGTDLTGEVLQVGDWIQSDGTKWVHVPGDLLSKQRWDSLGSFTPWSDTSWEKGSVVSYQQGFWRANALISTGDDPPENIPGNKWTDITPHPAIRLEELSNVETLPPGSYGESRFLSWDPVNDQWVASTTLDDVAGITFDGHPGQVIEEFVSDINAATNDDSAVPSVEAVKNYVTNLNLEDLADCAELAKATEGQVPVWNDTTGVWEPKTLTSPIIYLGSGTWDASKVGSKTDNYGMAADTQPDPKVWAPIVGDQYIDLLTGNVTVFTAGTGVANPASPPDRTASNIAAGASPKDLVGDYIPLFKGTFSTGNKNGNTYTPPSTPKEGDIWVDKNNTPPVFKVYRSGAWVQVNWQTDHLGLLSDLANVNVGASGSPGQGDALIFNQLTEQWESGSVPAHITEYDKNVNYSAGTTVYYKGGLFEAATRTSGTSPAFLYGDCWLYHRSAYNGGGDWVGPISFETVDVVPDASVTPTETHAADDLRPHWKLQWQDDQHFSVWMWELSMAGWTPGSPVPTARWHDYTARFTKPNAFRIWRNYSTPPQHVGDCVVWIYDDPKGKNQPHYRLFPWILRPIRSDLISMHDVQAENPADQSILIWNTSTSYWEAKPNPSYTKTEIDSKLANMAAGMAHEESVLDILGTPPANPQVDDLYLLNGTPAGAWAGHPNELAEWDGNAWKFITPKLNETHLVESTNTLWHWNGTAWVKVGEVGLRMQVLTQAAYDALGTKDAATLYLIQA